MCRLLAVIARDPIDPRDYLEPFAALAQYSREFQGHGWGWAIRHPPDVWMIYHSLKPIWEEEFPEIPPTTLLLAHTRSAYRDEGIAIENNMPFAAGQDVFIFNGELNGVRIREEGRIGAEKVFNFIRRFRDRGLAEAVKHGCRIIEERTRYVRAMNMILSDGNVVCARCRFSEDPDYFTLHYRPPADADDSAIVICSDPFPGESGWRPIGDGEMKVFPCS